jgi:protein-tyrosine-phosphatase
MAGKIYTVPFLCTGNSARSIFRFYFKALHRSTPSPFVDPAGR